MSAIVCVALALAETEPLVPIDFDGGLCETVPCRAPYELYSTASPLSALNFPRVETAVPKSTPDGINPYPCGSVPETPCNPHIFPNPCFVYCTTQLADWWSLYDPTAPPAFPTNAWWTPIFSTSPVDANPNGWVWPAYALPYSVAAAPDAFSVAVPIVIRATSGGTPGVAGDIDPPSAVPPQLTGALTIRTVKFKINGSALDFRRAICGHDAGVGVNVVYAAASPAPVAVSGPLPPPPPPGGPPSTFGEAAAAAAAGGGGGGGVGTMAIPLVKGTPYVTAAYGGAVPRLVFDGALPNFMTGAAGRVSCFDPSPIASPCALGVSGIALPSGLYAWGVDLGGDTHMYSLRVYASCPIAWHLELPQTGACGPGVSCAPGHSACDKPGVCGDGWALTAGPVPAGCAMPLVVRVAYTDNAVLGPHSAGSPVQAEPWYTSVAPEGRWSVDVAALDASAHAVPLVPTTGADVEAAVARGFDRATLLWLDSATPRPVAPYVHAQFASNSTTLRMSLSWLGGCAMPAATAADCASSLLMLALPHHPDPHQLGVAVPGVVYPSLRGLARGVVGSVWAVDTDFAAVAEPAMARALVHPGGAVDPLDSTQPPIPGWAAPTVRAQLRADAAYWTNATGIFPNGSAVFGTAAARFGLGDCYAFGKLVAAVARLALVADALGEDDLAASLRTHVRRRLAQWLDPTVTSADFPTVGWEYPARSSGLYGAELVYDARWGGVMTTQASLHPGPSWVPNGTQPDFGQGGYNDHLFHYGYYMYATAILLKGGREDDVVWFQKVAPRVLALARDVLSPSQSADPYFTAWRHKADWYEGHSWARGLYSSGTTASNIESTSEATNAWYGAVCLGWAMMKSVPLMVGVGRRLFDAGRVALVTDLQSTQAYFHTWSASSSAPQPPRELDLAYPPTLFRLYGVVGNLWGGSAVYQTFFSYGRCEWDGALDPAWCPHALTLDQIHYWNQAFTMQIQLLPYTAITPSLAPPGWLAVAMTTPSMNYTSPHTLRTSYGYDPTVIYDDLPSEYTTCMEAVPHTMCTGGWMPLVLSAWAGQGSAEAAAYVWKKLRDVAYVQDGATLTNVMWWVSTRPWTPPGDAWDDAVGMRPPRYRPAEDVEAALKARRDPAGAATSARGQGEGAKARRGPAEGAKARR